MLLDIEADLLTQVTLTPLSQVVGAADVEVKWTITLKNAIYPDSKI